MAAATAIASAKMPSDRPDAVNATVSNHNQAPRPETTLLDLPTELRIEIYRLVIGEPSKRPKHPYDDLHANMNLAQSSSLPLLNKHIRREALDLFDKEYRKDSLTYFFDDAPALYKTQEALQQLKCYRDCRFFIRRSTNRDVGSEGVLSLLMAQPGSEDLWTETERYLDPVPKPDFEAYVAGSEWHSFATGIKRIEGEECCAGAEKCLKYYEASYPESYNRLTVRGVAWEDEKEGYHCGVIVEGRFGDLVEER